MKQHPTYPNRPQVKLLRIDQSERSTLGHLYIDGIFACYTLEDALRLEKVPGQTAIPAGRYLLQLNSWGGLNKRYCKRFPEFHQGMLEIAGIPNFRYVYLHIGNTIRDTEGCPLAGHYWLKDRQGDFQLRDSSFTYLMVYPLLLQLVLSGPVGFEVVNQAHLKIF